MYEYIKGKLVERNPAYAIVEAGGIGYFINISIQTYSRLKEEEPCTLYLHQVIKEDAHSLYGFSDKGERELFRLLISVSGVGSTTARMILSSHTTGEVSNAILTGNVILLQGIKGIGSKTAQRIILDLKGKVNRELAEQEKVGVVHNTNREEALSGLIILGFQKMVASKALDKVIEGGGSAFSVEDLIRNALKIL